jgi:hypothetical protein
MCVAALPLVPFESRAQEGGADPLTAKHRNDCRLAAQALTTGHPRTKRDWAREYIAACENEGPPAIAQEWRTVRGDTTEVIQLMRASTRIRDARIYEAARAVVLDRSRPDVVRVGAMHVLDSYAVPGNAGWFVTVRPPQGPIRRVQPADGILASPVVARGPVPLDGSVYEPVLRLLQGVAAARASEPLHVWYAAAALAKRLGWQR